MATAKNQVDAIREASRSASTRLRGHELAWEGSPHTAEGLRIDSGWRRKGPGYGKCSCGALSPSEMPSTSKRQAWHRAHKLSVLADGLNS